MEFKGTQLLIRALDIVELLALYREGVSVTDISSNLNLHKSTVYRILGALIERGYAERSDDGSTYRLGMKPIELGSVRLNQMELKTEAVPVLRRLAESVKQPVHLAILSGLDAVYIEKIDPISNLRLYSQIGKRIPVYCSALGKVLLFGHTRPELEEMLRGTVLEKLTPHTLKTAREFADEVVGSANRGWAVDDEEHDAGIRCIAAPVYDYTGAIIAAVSMAGDTAAVPVDDDEDNAAKVIAAANEISFKIGWRGSIKNSAKTSNRTDLAVKKC